MSKFIKAISLFLTGLPLASGKVTAATLENSPKFEPPSLDPVQLRPLNGPLDNLFAAHRSHSSHRSHASHSSHYSSSGGGYSYSPSPSFGSDSSSSSSSYPHSNSYAAPPYNGSASQPALSAPPAQTAPFLNLAEKRKLQVMRVQIALTSLGLYSGNIDGVLNTQTKEALSLFQDLKGLPVTGLMTTETLNGLGVPAVK